MSASAAALLLLMQPGERDDWRDSAACRSADPRLMTADPPTSDEVAAALAVCVGCPVRAHCRALVESEANPHGVYDGEWFGQGEALAVASCQYAECGRSLTGRVAHARYCSQLCRTRAFRARKAAEVTESA